MRKLITSLAVAGTLMGANVAQADENFNHLILGTIIGVVIADHNDNERVVRYEEPRRNRHYDNRSFDRRVANTHRDIVIIEKKARSYDMCARGDGRCAGMAYDILRGRH